VGFQHQKGHLETLILSITLTELVQVHKATTCTHKEASTLYLNRPNFSAD